MQTENAESNRLRMPLVCCLAGWYRRVPRRRGPAARNRDVDSVPLPAPVLLQEVERYLVDKEGGVVVWPLYQDTLRRLLTIVNDTVCLLTEFAVTDLGDINRSTSRSSHRVDAGRLISFASRLSCLHPNPMLWARPILPKTNPLNSGALTGLSKKTLESILEFCVTSAPSRHG